MASDLIRVANATMTYGAFTLTAIGLSVTGHPSVAEWESCGRVLRRIEGAVPFWIGDWVNYGEKHYGGKFAAAVKATGLEQHTIEHYAYVAQNVRSSFRKEHLSFSAHSAVAPLTPAAQAEILDRAAADDLTVRDVKELVRATQHAAKVAAIARGDLPDGEFDVVVADPPWQYDNSGFEQSAANHYPTLTTDVIAALPSTDETFPKFADPCVLFLWGTVPLLPSAMTVLTAWGFEYRASFVWVKDRAPGIGWWLHTRHEVLLIGVRGTVTPLERVDSVIDAAADVHSRKPLEAYAAIERMFPEVRRVECFARTPRPGWQVWGNEV